jgi:putative membrane protein
MNLIGGNMFEGNDPRVFFAAERTLLAWTRTSLSLMAFGFVVERFGFFVHTLIPQQRETLQRDFSFWIGLLFITLGVLSSIIAFLQYRKVLRMLQSGAIPTGYSPNYSVLTCLVIAGLGAALIVYVFRGSPF